MGGGTVFKPPDASNRDRKLRIFMFMYFTWMIGVHKMIKGRNAEFIELYAKNARPERGQEPPDASKRDPRLLRIISFIM